MRVATEHHGDRRAMAAVGSYSETLSGWCGSHEGFERKVLCSPDSPTHILYNQALVGCLSMNATPTMWIVNVQLAGGSTPCMAYAYVVSGLPRQAEYSPGALTVVGPVVVEL